MKRFIQGVDRNQSTLFPETLDDYITEDNPVRVVEAFVDVLDLLSLGFTGAQPHATGRPAYHPSTLLKLYIYGYLNRIQSSRRLEREAQRNVELMWLTGRLTPDFKTIADFRKDHGQAIRNTCREFVVLCRQLNLFSQAVVAIDGSKFKAVNSRDNNLTRGKLKRRIEQVDKAIDRYFAQLDHADLDERPETESNIPELKEKIAALQKKMRELKDQEALLEQTPDKQISITDPDARAMSTSGNIRGTVGYNVQAAVDTENHLIVTHEVTNIGNDRDQLATMAIQAKKALQADDLTALADRGYFNGEELLTCAEAGIKTYVPKPETSGSQAAGRFDKKDFHYIAERNEYLCPANDRLIWRMTTEEKGRKLHRYWSSNCQACHLKVECTPSKQRRVTRWEHEAILEAAQERLERNPEMMLIRKSTVEHPFGTIKSWMGSTHFLTKTFKNVSTEMSLHVLAYNMKRVISILGQKALIRAIQA